MRTSPLRACLELSSDYSPAFEAVDIQKVDFANEFVQDSLYRGPPTIEREKAWGQISHQAHISLSRDDMRRLDRKDDVLSQYMKAPEEEGGGYVASLEVFHQLHCLNFVRQYYWFLQGQYSNETIPHYFTRPLDGPEYWRVHMDHCIETLRLTLMCHADVSPLLVKMNTSYDPPRQEAEFSARHRCRNFNKIMAWNKQNGLSVFGQ
ncbi:Putative mycotoxin biosynthesis protein UstYa [Septoria linicola]|uniref:Mycotoxin biosynthesis protein UstYa n=1 Tax=Septoria linicola TaxID=215465 RepID=A0A9Q9ENJ1_9PEZI|nr:putative mycotoxin biosynthesis protein UstYa [Septoria linicola]USW56672.1 Putative mycotoxin biosynthesis protein UstYa [Septoria linicola]